MIDNILNNKEKLRARLLKERNLAFKIVLSNKTTREIHLALRKVLTLKSMQKYVLKLYKQIKLDKDRQLREKNSYTPNLEWDKVYKESNALIFLVCNSYEKIAKEEYINSELEISRKEGKHFVLISSHNDCAKDHKDYQGKIYVDSKAKLTKEERAYVEKNNIKTFQWVIGTPVYLITRPNCRHYFKAIAFSEIGKVSLHSEIGDREVMQTPREYVVKKYKERLAYHEAIYKATRSEKMRLAVQKDKLLLKKWKSMVK